MSPHDVMPPAGDRTRSGTPATGAGAVTAAKKGLSFIAVREFVVARRGAAAWARALERLPPDEAEGFESILGVGWYGLDRYARLVRAVDATLGVGDLRAITPITRFEAERDLPTIHRLLLRLVKPAFVIERIADLWPRYHSTGALRVVRRGDRALEGTIRDWAADEALCVGFMGYCERALELAGARGVRVEHPVCRARGAASCVFRAHWGNTQPADA